MKSFDAFIKETEKNERETNEFLMSLITYFQNRDTDKNEAIDNTIIEGLNNALIKHYITISKDNRNDFFRKLFNDITGNTVASEAFRINNIYGKKIKENLAFLIDCLNNGYFNLDDVEFCIMFISYYDMLSYIDFERGLFIIDNVKEERACLNEWHLNNITNKIQVLNITGAALQKYIQNKEEENEKRVYKNTR